MFDFGDDLSLETYRIPWLIWIQLLVLFLLIALLYCFTVFASDPSDDVSAVTTAAAVAVAAGDSPSTSRLLFDDVQQMEKPSSKNESTATTLEIHLRRSTQGGENRNIKGEISAGTSRRIVSAEEMPDMEGPSSFHPCHYFQLARVAFLKCLGLDSASDSNPTRKQRKRKES